MGQGVSLGEASQERYFLQKVKLGEGSFGTVWRAVDRQENTIVAVKQLDKALLPKRGVRRQDIEREVAVMRAVSHPNVTKLFGSWEDSASIFLALEYCNGGDFGDEVKEKGMELEEGTAAEWMFQIVSAIGVLHSKSICHRDIKPDNFMVHDEVLKLSDFGLAVHLPFGQKLTEKCGTPAFMSPEQHQLPRGSKGYSHSCDVWAAGITMYMVMFAGKHPFLLASQQLDEQALLAGQLDFSVGSSFFGFAMTDRFSESARFFCRQMVTPDMGKRISAAAACHSEWFREQAVGKFRHPQEADPVPKEGSPVICKPPASPGIARVQSNVTVDGGKDKEESTQRWWPFSAETPSQPSKPKQPEAAEPEEQQEKQELQQELLQHRRALQGQGSPRTSHVDDELRKRIQGLEEQLRQHEEQSRLREEQNRLQKEQNESQWEMLVQMQQFIKDKKMTQDLEATMAGKTTPPEPVQPASQVTGETSPTGQPTSSRSYSRRTVSATAAPPEMQQIPAVQTLRAGMRCRYYSSTYGRWISAKVEKYHPNGTFDLDVKQHASLDYISPLPDVAEAEAWPPGTSVCYNSTSAKRWIPAVVQSFNASGPNAGTYNLDVRPCADCDRIKPKLLKHEAMSV